MGSIDVSQDGLPQLGLKTAKEQVANMNKHGVDIIDIRRAAVETNLKDDIIAMWNPTNGPRKLPTLLVYNERGLQLFEEARAFINRATSCVIGANSSSDHIPRRILPDQQRDRGAREVFRGDCAEHLTRVHGH